MDKKVELLKNTFVILMGKICTQFLSFFLLPLYTDKLTSEEFGFVDFVTTYIILIAPVISMQLEMAIFRFLIDNRKNENRIENIISSAYINVGIQTIISLIIYLLVSCFISFPYSTYILFYAFGTIVLNQLLQTARGLGDNIGYSIACIISGSSTIILNLIFLLKMNMKIEGLLLACIIGNILGSIYLLIRCRINRYLHFKSYKRSETKMLLKYSIPLIPNGLIWWIINVSDRTIVTLFLGVGSNGVYAVSNRFSNLLIQVFNIFNMSWTESASVHIYEKDSYINDMFNIVIKSFLTLCVAMISVIPICFSYLVNESFFDAYYYIPILLLGMFFDVVVSFIGSLYIALKKTNEIAKTSLYSGIINLVINIVLIRFIGIYAAAISTVFAFMIMALYRYIDVKKYVVLKIDFRSLILLAISLILSFFVYYYQIAVLVRINFVFSFIICIYVNRNLLSELKNYKNILIKRMK